MTITPDQIPDAVVEAASKAIIDYMGEDGYVYDTAVCARLALCAGLKAWVGCGEGQYARAHSAHVQGWLAAGGLVPDRGHFPALILRLQGGENG